MNKIVMIALAVMLLSGCQKYPEYVLDQKERKHLFAQCMASLPEGPTSTTYNDWDEVVSECDTTAREQSMVCIRNCEYTY